MQRKTFRQLRHSGFRSEKLHRQLTSGSITIPFRDQPNLTGFAGGQAPQCICQFFHWPGIPCYVDRKRSTPVQGLRFCGYDTTSRSYPDMQHVLLPTHLLYPDEGWIDCGRLHHPSHQLHKQVHRSVYPVQTNGKGNRTNCSPHRRPEYCGAA